MQPVSPDKIALQLDFDGPPVDGQALVYSSSTETFACAAVAANPGGSSGQIQVNNAGAFGGATGIFTNIAGSLLTVSQATGSEAPFRARSSGGTIIAGFDSSGYLLGPAGIKLFHGGASTAYDNTFIGYSVGNATLSGTQNFGVGKSVLESVTTGLRNLGFGNAVLDLVTTGSRNVAVGIDNGNAITTGSYNCLFGYHAGFSVATSAIGNCLFGDECGQSVTGSRQTSFGYASLYSATNGTANASFGGGAGFSVTTGSYNTLLGDSADVTSGSLTRATAVGYNAQVGASNTLALGGTGTDYARVVIGATTGSALFNVTAKSATDSVSFNDTGGTRQSGVDVNGLISVTAGAGAPGSTPTYAGALYFDTTAKKIYAWDGSAWLATAALT